MEYPVREPCPPKCCYPDMRRSNPTCEAPGTTASIWEHRSGGGPAEDGRLNASERPWLRSVIQNRPKVLTGRSQNGTRVGSSSGTLDNGGNTTCRTIGRSRPIRISTLDNRVSPTRSAASNQEVRECQKPGALRRESDCVLAEASVQHRGPDLKYAVGAAGRPAHLPALVHAGTHQLVDGALGP